jgi:glutamine amidotransferase-like uncharacterized protein
MRPRIAIFEHDPECSQDCVDGMIASLHEDFDILIFDESQFSADTLANCDIVAFPGGLGNVDMYYSFFKRQQGNVIADFVASGGKYLGICMGAYWAGRDYFDLLINLDPVQYITQQTADVRRSYPTVANVDWQGTKHNMYFYDGCTFVGNGRCQTIARYSNDMPMAIIQGRVGLIGCHPESQQEWYDKKYLRKHWHNGEHNKMLNSFAKKLLRQK